MAKTKDPNLYRSNKTLLKHGTFKIEAVRWIMRVFSDREKKRGNGLIRYIEETLPFDEYSKKYVHADKYNNTNRILPYEPVKHFLNETASTPDDPDIIDTFVEFIKREATLKDYEKFLVRKHEAVALGDAWIKYATDNKGYPHKKYSSLITSDSLLKELGLSIAVLPDGKTVLCRLQSVFGTPYLTMQIVGYEDIGIYDDLNLNEEEDFESSELHERCIKRIENIVLTQENRIKESPIFFRSYSYFIPNSFSTIPESKYNDIPLSKKINYQGFSSLESNIILTCQISFSVHLLSLTMHMLIGSLEINEPEIQKFYTGDNIDLVADIVFQKTNDCNQLCEFFDKNLWDMRQ